MVQKTQVDTAFSSDACLTGIGARCGEYYIHHQCPEHIKQNRKYSIAHIEFLAVIVALKAWHSMLTGIRARIHCDNMAVVQVVRSGSARDALMQDLLREYTYVCAIHQKEVEIVHIKGLDNRDSDILSRIHTDGKYVKQFEEIKKDTWKRTVIHDSLFEINTNW